MPQIKYNKAIQRLDEIINRIENEEIDVDDLAQQVKEAVGLIKVCKEKIKKAEMEVKEAAEGFEDEMDVDGEEE